MSSNSDARSKLAYQLAARQYIMKSSSSGSFLGDLVSVLRDNGSTGFGEHIAKSDGSLDEEDRLSRPQIWINREKQVGKSAGAWTIVIEIASSDYGWHVEFVRTKFKEIWAGD